MREVEGVTFRFQCRTNRLGTIQNARDFLWKFKKGGKSGRQEEKLEEIQQVQDLQKEILMDSAAITQDH